MHELPEVLTLTYFVFSLKATRVLIRLKEGSISCHDDGKLLKILSNKIG